MSDQDYPTVAEWVHTASVELQADANTVAAILHQELADVPRKFVERVSSADVQHLAILKEGYTLEFCVEFLAKGIKTAVGDGSVQFIRRKLESGMGYEWTNSESYDHPPINAMVAFDVRSGKVLKRFDVWFVVHPREG